MPIGILALAVGFVENGEESWGDDLLFEGLGEGGEGGWDRPSYPVAEAAHWARIPVWHVDWS